MGHFITSIRTSGATNFFGQKVNEESEEYASKADKKKYRQSSIKKKDHLPFILRPEISKPDSKVAPLSEHLKKLSPEKIAQVGVNVVSNLARKNFGGAIAVGVQGVAGLWSGQPAGAVSANVSADNSEGGLEAFFNNNELTRPFAFRLKRLFQAVREYTEGQGSGSQLTCEFGKVGLIVGGAFAALGVSILTAGGFDGLLQAVSVSASVFTSLTSFSVPTLIQSLTATTPLACSFLSAAHVIADQLMQSEMAKESKGNIDGWLRDMKSTSGKKIKVMEAEVENAVESACLLHSLYLRKNSASEIARRAFLKTYKHHWPHLRREDFTKAKSLSGQINHVLKTNQALKSKADLLWEKIQCWHDLNAWIQALSIDGVCKVQDLTALNIPAPYKRQLGKEAKQLPYTALIIREELQEEVEKELGAKLDRETGNIFSAETGRQLELNYRSIMKRLAHYQKRVFLGGYLAEHYMPAGKTLAKVWADSERYTRNITQKRGSEQVKALAGFLLKMTAAQFADFEKTEARRPSRRLPIKGATSQQQLDAVLTDQLSLLKKALDLLTGSHESDAGLSGRQRKRADVLQGGKDCDALFVKEGGVVPEKRRKELSSTELVRLRQSVGWINRSS
ncbi:hypothetical protein N9V90_00225 [Endozoicomonas sp.]|nr:hypothetical protein [Endozoicomonas sp.]